ncbi:unnamed protein product [marine sediment metagenome]|uniref:Uncharacterized protein n=1 Tax=marine sediment metagenome TaxID=412755 RepID=X1PZN0_9ZZZZ
MRKKKKGPVSRQPSGPERMTKVKRLVNFKQASSGNQCLILKFDKDHPGLTFDEAGAVLTFIGWLEINHYSVIHGGTVFCVPFSHLVKKKDLK